MLKTGTVRKRTATLLAALAMIGGTVFSSCTLADVRHNIVNGTLSFVEDYTIDVLEALLPSVDELIGTGGEG